MIQKATSLIRQWDGKLTRDLLLQPGKFGLGKVPARLIPDKTTNMICGFCATGCSLKVHMKDDQAINLSAHTDYPVNIGMACPKGWEALSPLSANDRGNRPLLRNEHGDMEEISWDQAMTKFTQEVKAVQSKYGKDSVAFISTGQIPFEEMALLGSVAKFGMGMVHGDGNTRQCMATAVVAYKQSFGFDAPPYTYQDFEESDVIVLVGSNMCIAHPIMWERIKRNPNDPNIIVVDPRNTETAMMSTSHVDIDPKSDLHLFYGLAKLIIDNGWVDQDYLEKNVNDYEEFFEFVKDYSIDDVIKETGVSKEKIETMATAIGEGKKVSFWWTMGVNQGHEGVRVAQSIINLALMTGNMGKPGTGANSITGQCNAMGSRLFSNTTNLLGGHDFTNEDHRLKVANKLNIPVTSIPSENSMAYDQIIEGISSGKIKALWVIATNTAHSWINQNGFKSIAKNLEFLCVQDMYTTTETVEIADMFFPVAGWGEKEGCFINSERRIGRIKKVSKAPGRSLADFYVFKLVAEYYGCGDMFKDWDSPESVFKILRGLTEGQPCDITGIEDYKMIEENGGIQWPLKKGEEKFDQQRRLFEDGKFYHPDQKAKMLFEAPRRVGEPVSKSLPYNLITGRGTSSQWHTQTRTSKSAVLNKLSPQEIYAEVNPDDAKELEIRDNEWIYVVSRRGRIKVKAFITTSVKPKQIFIPMHYKETNQLTFPSFDKYSRQPSYKTCAVNLMRVEYWDEA